MPEKNEMQTAVKIDITKEDIIDHLVEKHLEPIREQLFELKAKQSVEILALDGLLTDRREAQRVAIEDHFKELIDIDEINSLLDPISAELCLTWGDQCVDELNKKLIVTPMIKGFNGSSCLECYGHRREIPFNREIVRLNEAVQAKQLEVNKLHDKSLALSLQTNEGVVRCMRAKVKSRIMDQAMSDVNGKLQKMLTGVDDDSGEET